MLERSNISLVHLLIWHGEEPCSSSSSRKRKSQILLQIGPNTDQTRSYENTIEQSVQSVPCKPLWLIFLTKGIGSNGNFATTLPSNIEFMSPNTTIKTTSTTPPDLNFARDRSRVDSLREVSTRSSFFELGADLFEGNLSISSFFDAR
jgi:hypothetical protein